MRTFLKQPNSLEQPNNQILRKVKVFINFVTEKDRQTGKQSLIQSQRSRKNLGYVPLILRLYCKQEVKDIYVVSQFFGLNIFSE